MASVFAPAVPGIDHIRIDGVSRAPAGRRVLTDVSLVVGPDARVGLIGENGSGKSTLLRIVAGLDEPDAGSVAVPGRTGLLRQEPVFPGTATVAGVLDSALADAANAIAEVEAASDAVAAGEAGAERRLGAALAAADRLDAWGTAARRGEVVAGVGIGDLPPGAAVRTLSGGQRSRLALAALLLERPNALLLDEPTNHLDDAAVDFLQTTLSGWRGPVLFASHDRGFLDAVATRIADLDPSPLPHARTGGGDDAGSGYGLSLTRGGYSAYLADRRSSRARWEQRFAEEQEALDALRHEVEIGARSTNRKSGPRNEGGAAKKFFADRDAKVTARRVRNAAVRLQTLEREQVRKPPPVLAFAGMPAGRRLAVDGPLLVTASAGVVDRLAPVDLAISSGGKLLVTGANGVGKSTLLHLLHGDLAATSGSVARAPGVSTALLAQDVAFDEPRRSARVTYAAAIGAERSEERPLSELGLVAGRDLDRAVGALSVGQQRRLALAIVLADPPEVLLLDEPTNHLSPVLVEELEDAFDAHPGAVVLASHDRRLRERWTHERLMLGTSG